MKIILVLIAIFALALTGCASSGDYKEYISAQSEANRRAVDDQKPLVEIEAQEGQQITGLRRIRVFMPVSPQTVQQARPNEWVGLFGQGLSILGTVAGLQVTGKAAIGLADAVGGAATKGYASVQAPAANMTTIDKSNHSVTTGATSSIVGSYNPSDSSTHSTPTTNITGSYNPATSTTTTNPAADPVQ